MTRLPRCYARIPHLVAQLQQLAHTDISTRRPVAGAGRPEGEEQRATGARAFVRSAEIHGKRCATHPVTRFVFRQGAYVAVADSPGKHGIYSVRVGSYGSSQEAAAAKTAFEKQTNTIAYVAGR